MFLRATPWPRWLPALGIHGSPLTGHPTPGSVVRRVERERSDDPCSWYSYILAPYPPYRGTREVSRSPAARERLLFRSPNHFRTEELCHRHKPETAVLQGLDDLRQRGDCLASGAAAVVHQNDRAGLRPAHDPLVDRA